MSVSLRSALATQVRFWIIQLQIASFGVGGSAVAACQVSVVGQACAELVGL